MGIIAFDGTIGIQQRRSLSLWMDPDKAIEFCTRMQAGDSKLSSRSSQVSYIDIHKFILYSTESIQINFTRYVFFFFKLK